MNTLTSLTVYYSDSGKNIASALMGDAEKRGHFQLLAGKLQGEDVHADHCR